MTAAAMLAVLRSLQLGLDELRQRVAALQGLLRAPVWASLFPPATFYVVASSLSLETRTYLAREALAARFDEYAAELAELTRQATAAGGEAVGDPSRLAALQGHITADGIILGELEGVYSTAQASTDDTLARIPEAGTNLAEAPLKALAAASWVSKYGVWVAVGLAGLYVWKSGGVGGAVRSFKKVVA